MIADRTLPLLLATLLFFFLTMPAGAAEPATAQAAQALKNVFPQIPVEEIHASPVPGLYEVVSGGKVLYFSPDTGHLLVGELWSKEGKNLSKERLGNIMTRKLKEIPLDKALKIGSGRNIVIEVSDPDCPFCRDGSKFFSGRDDVTRYIFMHPLRMHPDAEEKAKYILSAENPADAYEAVMSGEYDNAPLPEFEDNGQLEIHRKITEYLGVNSTPKYWVNGQFISGANFDQINQLLDQPPK